ncbi:MAG: hypothetical protein NWS68_04630, partial [Erythrobacter sp.]|nr:hypothetical protein [Erythrobacter sp.]
MAGSFLGRILGGLTGGGGRGGGDSGNLPVGKLTAFFTRLDKARSGLTADAVRYIAKGDNTSVILTLQHNATGQMWRTRHRIWPDRDREALFARPQNWRIDQIQRLGEVLAALEPIAHDWGFFGTRKSPDWLRHVLSLWLPRERDAQPVAVLADLAAQSGDAIAPVLDIVFARDPHNYNVSNSIARFTGLGEWMDGARDAIIAAAPGLAADVRAELAASIGRFGLQATYGEMLIDLACGSAKKVRVAARQALTASDPARLAAALEARFAKAAPGVRAELVTVAAGSLGDAAAPVLARWRETETAPKVIAALDQAGGVVTAMPGDEVIPAPVSDRPDGPEGYTAIDGRWVDAGGPFELPQPSPVPADLLASLEPAMQEFNRLLAKGKAEAKRERWHWSKQFHPKDKGALQALGRLAEGTTPLVRGAYRPAVDWLAWRDLKHPAIDAFFHDPRLTLRHLARLSVTMTNGYVGALFGGYAARIGSAVQARLTDGDAVRSFIALWVEAGGTDFIDEELTLRWSPPLPDFDAPLWPALCARFDAIDQALGLVPQDSAAQKRPQSGLALLTHFPKLPARYRNRLLVMAGDSAAQLRDAARGLLKDTPGIDGAIAVQLGDGKQDVRALAAEWLAARGATAQIPAIRAALAKDKSDVARAAMITALQKLGEDVSHLFDPAVLIKEAKAGLAKTKPKGLDLLLLDMLQVFV